MFEGWEADGEVGPLETNVVQTRSAPLPLDISRYRQEIADLPLTEEQQIQLLQALWDMMRTFVELGFGCDPVQQVIPAAIAEAFNSESGDLEEEEAAALICKTTKGKDRPS